MSKWHSRSRSSISIHITQSWELWLQAVSVFISPSLESCDYKLYLYSYHPVLRAVTTSCICIHITQSWELWLQAVSVFISPSLESCDYKLSCCICIHITQCPYACLHRLKWEWATYTMNIRLSKSSSKLLPFLSKNMSRFVSVCRPHSVQIPPLPLTLSLSLSLSLSLQKWQKNIPLATSFWAPASWSVNSSACSFRNDLNDNKVNKMPVTMVKERCWYDHDNIAMFISWMLSKSWSFWWSDLCW